MEFLESFPAPVESKSRKPLSLIETRNRLYMRLGWTTFYQLEGDRFRLMDMLDENVKSNQVRKPLEMEINTIESSEMMNMYLAGVTDDYLYFQSNWGTAKSGYLDFSLELKFVNNKTGQYGNYPVYPYSNAFTDYQVIRGDGYFYIHYPGMYDTVRTGLFQHRDNVIDTLNSKNVPMQVLLNSYPPIIEYRNHLFLLGRMAELVADTLDFAQAIRVEKDGTVREDIWIKNLAESEDRLFAVDSAGAKYVFDDADMVFKPIEEGSSIKHPADRLQIRKGNEISIDYGETFTEITQVSEVNQIATLGSRVFISAEDWKKVYEVMNIGSLVNGDVASPFYPNPSGSGIFHSPEPISGGRIYDISGRAVDAMISGDRIDLGTAPAGVYYLVTESGERHVLVRE
jgi:hypothetical protein